MQFAAPSRLRRQLRLALVVSCLAACANELASHGEGREPAEDAAPTLPARDASIDASHTPVDAAADARLDATPDTRTRIRVHYAGAPGTLSLRGSTAPLSWDANATLEPIGADVFEWSNADIDVPFELKPMLDATWSLGPNYTVTPHTTVDITPHFSRTTGLVARRWASFNSNILPSTRGIWVYLPPTYVENTVSRFDVLYMHDGQNLFSAETAGGSGEWQVDETLDQGAASGTIRETIVIGIENTPNRIHELTPTPDPEHPEGGGADAYLAMLRSEIMPMVDAELRTNPGREHTALMGSSLGGLISVHAAVTQSDRFGLVGAMSPSTWWDRKMILAEVEAMPAQRPTRIYVDSGDSGDSNDDRTNTAELAQTLREIGYVEGQSLRYVVQAGAEHNETYWAQRLPGALAFLLGPGR